MDLSEVGGRGRVVDGQLTVDFGLYLPGIRFVDGYAVVVRIIHEADQFTPGVAPEAFFLDWHDGHPLDLWRKMIELAPTLDTNSHFGQAGRYLYRFQLLHHDRPVTFWFSDPFARESGSGTRSSVNVGVDAGFSWEDDGFKVPPINDLVVYELMVDEFNRSFDGVVARLDYLAGLGVNAIEFMPLTNVSEPYRWGYMPLSFLAPEDRYGGTGGLKRLVNECHKRGIAVIADAVYAHAHHNFAYNQIYRRVEIENPMMGPFAEDSFGIGTDFSKPFTQQFFQAVNRHWLDEYHVDGFRYDYVPGFYDGPLGNGYANLVFQTYQHSRSILRFADPQGHSRIVQCAEHLPDPQGIVSQTYSNACWQNHLLDKAEDMAHYRYADDGLAHLLDLDLSGYPRTYSNPASGDQFPVSAFQYIESHDHSRLITQFGTTVFNDAFGRAFGDRGRYWFKLQPFVIALYTGQGVPMLWQGQEFAENYTVPHGGYERVLARRPLHWEYFYDQAGKGLIRLYRIMGRLRREHRALRSRTSWYYHDISRPGEGLIIYRREAEATDTQAAEKALVFLNFSDHSRGVDFPFPDAGVWREVIDENESFSIASPGQVATVVVPSNYGRVLVKD